jgi:pilus assembly protein Flp/PilA
MLRALKRLWADEAGLTTVEYALLLVLIVAAAVTAWTQLGTNVNTEVGNVRDTITTGPE